MRKKMYACHLPSQQISDNLLFINKHNFSYSLSTKIIACDHNGKSTRSMPSCSSTAEPHNKEDHKNYFVTSGLSLHMYQCKKTKKYKGLGPEKLPSSCYKIVVISNLFITRFHCTVLVVSCCCFHSSCV